jgi:hypothetical protein
MKNNRMKLGLFAALCLSATCVSAQATAQSSTAGASGLRPGKEVSKDAQIPKHLDLPGYPVFVNTGNMDLDRVRFEEARLQWVAENKALYEAYLVTQGENVEKLSDESTYISIDELPGFPKLERTGDPDGDVKRYDAEKAKFYEENRALIEQVNTENARRNQTTKSEKN